MNDHIAKLGLGTVQFGMDYGISNSQGRPSELEVRRILDIAGKAGIRLLDTACLYGDSEQVLGRTLSWNHDFQIVTKTPHFSNPSLTPEDYKQLITSFHSSLRFLGQKRVYGLMIHNPDDLLRPGGEYLLQAMQDLKNKDLVHKIGVSVYEAGEIEAVTARHKIDLIQVPVSILDQRLIQSGHLKAMKRLGVEVHARSIFLQGLLLLTPEELPDYLAPLEEDLKNFHQDCAEQGVSPLGACLNFVLGLPEVDYALAGVCTKKELDEILASTSPGIAEPSKYARQEKELLNPGLWRAQR